MSRNAVAAMAVVLVSGFAGCAATARASEPVVSSYTVPAPAAQPVPPRLSPQHFAPVYIAQPALHALSAAESG